MPQNLPIWIFIGGRSVPMLLVYILEQEIKVGQSGGVKIKIAARLLHTLFCNDTSMNISVRNSLMNLLSRKRHMLKRITNISSNNRNNRRRENQKNILNRIQMIKQNLILTQNIRNAGSGGSPSDSGQEDASEGSPQMPRLPSPQAVLPDQTSNLDVNVTGGLFELPENANPIQTSTWLRANGFQSLEATFRDYSASDFRHLTRNDLIEICGLVKGIQLYNRIKSRPLVPQRTLYFAIENNDSPVWKIVYLHNLTSEALTTELLSKFNLPQDRLHSIWVQGPRSIRILICNEIVENMKDENLYLIEIIKDSPNDRYKLLLKPFSHG